MAGNPAARAASVDGRTIAVLDDVISKRHVSELTEALRAAPFRRSEYARRETSEIKHWAVNLSQIGPALCDPFVEVSAKHVDRFFGPGRELYRAYCNVALYGDMLFTHYDAKPDDDHVTALWYVCTKWDTEWGGETLFYDRRGDAVFVVSPRPGRLVLFDGAIRHAGRPPNRICHEARFSVAIKFCPPSAATSDRRAPKRPRKTR